MSAVQIPLREKYLAGFRSTFKGGERGATLKHRKKIGNATKADRDERARITRQARTVTLVVDGRTGRSHFEVLR